MPRERILHIVLKENSDYFRFVYEEKLFRQLPSERDIIHKIEPPWREVDESTRAVVLWNVRIGGLFPRENHYKHFLDELEFLRVPAALIGIPGGEARLIPPVENRVVNQFVKWNLSEIARDIIDFLHNPGFPKSPRQYSP